MSKKIKNLTFRKSIHQSSTGARTLGYVDLTVLDGDGDETEYRDLKVRVNFKSVNTLCAPGRKFTNKDGKEMNRSAYKFGDELYAKLVNAIFRLPPVIAAKEESEPKQLELDV